MAMSKRWISLVSAALCSCSVSPSPEVPRSQPTGATTASTGLTPVQLANPASVNCAEQGGRHVAERTPAGGEFGVCLFEDNRQCEEWALLRGHCPVGGRRVTGYATPAARYCAITGGSYAVTARSGAEDEQGTCTLPDGTSCAADAYYAGTCAAAPNDPA